MHMPMTEADFKEILDSILTQCREVLSVKGRDYASSVEDNRLRNFETTAKMMGISPLKVITIFMQKHRDAIDAYTNTGRVESESLEGRIVDHINYLLLYYAQVVALESQCEVCKEYGSEESHKCSSEYPIC